jgi:hypothetical protein
VTLQLAATVVGELRVAVERIGKHDRTLQEVGERVRAAVAARRGVGKRPRQRASASPTPGRAATSVGIRSNCNIGHLLLGVERTAITVPPLDASSPTN